MATRSVPVQKTKWEAFSEFVWDSENKAVIGRNGKSWCLITIFYIILYTLLAGFFIGCMALFFKTTNLVHPNRIGMECPMKLHPGMAFIPRNGLLDTIEIKQGKEEKDYVQYINQITDFLELYKNNQTNNIDCSNMTSDEIAASDSSCLYPIDLKVPNGCESSPYGYTEGTPCLILKLNKVYNFVPQLEESSPGIQVTCEGVKDHDKKNIEFEIKPSFLDRKFYPYKNRQGYVSPYVVVKVMRIETGVKVNVWCKAHSGNLKFHRNDRAASVTFSIEME